METCFLQILACPLCKGKLLYDSQDQELICRFDKMAFSIEEGVPNMLLESARKLIQGEY